MNRSLMVMVVLAVLGVVVLQVTLSGLPGLAEEREEKSPTVASVAEERLQARLLGPVEVEQGAAEGSEPGQKLVVTANLTGSFAPRAVASDLLDALHESLPDFGANTQSFRLVLNPDSPRAAVLEPELPWLPARRFVGDPVKSLLQKPTPR